MDAVIEKIFRHTAVRYGGMLARLRPCKPGSEFLEQNLVTLFCHEFLTEFPCGIAYTELPFAPALPASPCPSDIEKADWSNRLDAFLATEQAYYFLEAKCLSNKVEKLKDVEGDLERIREKPGPIACLDYMASGTDNDDRAYCVPAQKNVLIIADCWTKEIADKWLAQSDLALGHHTSQLTRKAYHIAQFGSFDYYVLAGQLSLAA